MSIKKAFNLISRLHSRAATLKRFGTPDIYSPIRITPSNYFRFLEGPGSSTIHGREFIIPVDTMTGHYTQLVTFGSTPTQGGFHLTYGVTDTAAIAYNDTNADVETALQAISGLENVTVTGNFTSGFLITFIGVNAPTILSYGMETPALQNVSNQNVVITIAFSDSVAWSPKILRGDKIVDTIYGSMAVDEIVEMVDLGGAVMGYRVRAE